MLINLYKYLKESIPFKLWPATITTIVLVALLLCPVPEGLTPKSWMLLAIFITTIVAIILKVMVIGVMSLMAVMWIALSQVTAPTGLEKVASIAISDALSSYSNPLIWLIVVSVMISRGLKKTGLGARIAYHFIAFLGKKTLGVGYGLAICELFLAPFTPSNTARCGGIIHPIMRSIATAFDSDPEKNTQNKIGTYLALVNYHSNPITSAMFITATAPNPLVVDLVAKATNSNFHLSWGAWALYMFAPGLIAILLMPLAIYFLSPPEIKTTPTAVTFAKGELEKLGQVSPPEIIMIGVFLLLLILWADVPAMIFGSAFSFNATTVAFLGLFLLLLTGTLTWDDVLSEKSAWDTLIWFGALIMLATQLNKHGVISWFSDGLREMILSSGMNWGFASLILILVFLFSHYFFASTTAHISAMMLAFLTVGTQIIPSEFINLFMLIMVSASAIMMGLTHYATGTSPIIFGSNYVTMGHWWKIGFIMACVNLSIFIIIGGLWWKLLGVW